MSWVVEIGDEFELEFDALHEDVKPGSWHCRVFSKSSAHNWGGRVLTRSKAPVAQNMKELRCSEAEGNLTRRWR